MLPVVILIILPFLLLFPGTMASTLCLEKSKNEINSPSVLSVACSNGIADISIRRESGLVGEANIQLDYYCYHLNNMSLFKSEIMGHNIQVSSSSQLRYENTLPVQENSLCVFVSCVEKRNVWPRTWYFINGNGSTCSNKVDISTTPAITSSSIEGHSTTATDNNWISITESITPSLLFSTTTAELSQSSSSYYFTTTANNEWTAITESTSTTLSGITTTSVGQIPFSSYASEVTSTSVFLTTSDISSSITSISSAVSSSYASEVTSTSVVLTTSDISSSITSISFAVFSSSSPDTNRTPTDVGDFSWILPISIGVLSFILILLISLLAILWYLKRQTSLKPKFNQDLIFGMNHLLKLPEEHLKLTSSTHTICTDPIICASHKQTRTIPASQELRTECNKSIGRGINNDGLLEVLETDASYGLQHIHDVLDEGQTDNCSKLDMLSQSPVKPPSVYNEIGYITV